MKQEKKMLQVSKSLLPQSTAQFTELLNRNHIFHLAGFTVSRCRMATLRAAKQALRKDIKRRVAALSDKEKQRQSVVVAQQVRESSADWEILKSCHGVL